MRDLPQQSSLSKPFLQETSSGFDGDHWMPRRACLRTNMSRKVSKLSYVGVAACLVTVITLANRCSALQVHLAMSANEHAANNRSESALGALPALLLGYADTDHAVDELANN